MCIRVSLFAVCVSVRVFVVVVVLFVFSRRGVLLSLCPCGHRLLLGLLPARPKAEVLTGLPRLCADRTARRLL